MILKLIDFLTRTFGTGKDTTATILVTFFTFSAGILITLIFKAVEGYLNRRNHRKLARLNIINLMKEMFRQATAYKKFAEDLKIETVTPAFKQISISSVGVLYQLGYKNLYDSFFNGIENIRFRNKRRIAFSNLWSALEYLTVFHQKTFKDAREFIESEKVANDLRNKSIGETYKIINTLQLKKFRDFTQTANQGNYLIISNPSSFPITSLDLYDKYDRIISQPKVKSSLDLKKAIIKLSSNKILSPGTKS